MKPTLKEQPAAPSKSEAYALSFLADFVEASAEPDRDRESLRQVEVARSFLRRVGWLK